MSHEQLQPAQVPEGEIILAEGVPMSVSPASSFENTISFFSAMTFLLDQKNPPKPFGYKKSMTQTFQQWVRNWEILGRHLGTDAVLVEIGDQGGVTGEGVRQVVKRLVSQSWDVAPAALREAFPRESLSTKKPYSLHKGMRISQARGGKMRAAIEAVIAGKSAVPYKIEAQTRKYQENLGFLAGGILDDRQILAIFEDIERHNRLEVCRHLRKAGILVSLRKAARNEGVFPPKRLSAAYRLLKELEIPVLQVEQQVIDESGRKRIHTYRFVLNNHERTKEAFAHPSFDTFRTNPVEVLGRATLEIPTTSITKDPEYISMVSFLKEKEIPIKPEEVRGYLDPNCPVSVYYLRVRRDLFIRKEDAASLGAYLAKKLTNN